MEDKTAYFEFLSVWHTIMLSLSAVSLLVAVLIFVIYKIRYAGAPTLKEKHDLASEKEIRNYLTINYAIAASIFFFLNTVYDETVELAVMWVVIRVFISACIATLHIYIAYLIFKYYYPGPLSKKLKKLRYTPRVHVSGRKMQLLSEDQEDAYLDEGMQAEEDAFSVDYDVWIDTVSGETLIEKYRGHLSALECDRCGFQTLKLKKEEVLKEPTDFEDGEILKEYKCSYCGRVKRKEMKLSKKVDKTMANSKLIADPLKHDKRISLIRLEIHSNKGDKKEFDFQNIDQAKHFLEEFDFEKLEEEAPL